MYVVHCQNKAHHNQIFCVQVLICLQYGQICCRDNCSVISIVYFKIACFWYKIKLSRFKMARNVEKLWARLLIWCYAWCLVISKIWSWLVFKINWKVQAIMCAFCDINFFKIQYLYRYCQDYANFKPFGLLHWFHFFARISRYNTMNLRNNTVQWCQETCIVGTRALFCLKYGSRNFGIMQIIFLWGHSI